MIESLLHADLPRLLIFGAVPNTQLMPRLLELAQKALQEKREEKAALQSLQLSWQWLVTNWWVG